MAAEILRHAALALEHLPRADLERVQRAFSTAGTISRRQMFGARARELVSS